MSMTESEVIDRILYMGVGRSGLENENSCIAKALKENQQYRAIGTLEELRELKEKHEPIKALGGRYSWDCPSCGTFHSTNGKYCSECGQAVELD